MLWLSRWWCITSAQFLPYQLQIPGREMFHDFNQTHTENALEGFLQDISLKILKLWVMHPMRDKWGWQQIPSLINHWKLLNIHSTAWRHQKTILLHQLHFNQVKTGVKCLENNEHLDKQIECCTHFSMGVSNLKLPHSVFTTFYFEKQFAIVTMVLAKTQWMFTLRSYNAHISCCYSRATPVYSNYSPFCLLLCFELIYSILKWIH